MSARMTRLATPLATPLPDVERRAATAVGVGYLLALPLALFAEFYVHSQLTVSGDAAEFARSVIAHERLFRLGIVSTVAAAVVDTVLIAALYLTLRPVDAVSALVAMIVRIIETVIVVGVALVDLVTLRVVTGADYLQVLGDRSLQSLARLSWSVHGDITAVSLLLAGIGSTLFCWLWFRSHLVPRPLAALGIVGSIVLALREVAVMVVPPVTAIVTIPYYGGPIFVFELTMGLWLVTKGVADRSER